jgi:hypothetical protein
VLRTAEASQQCVAHLLSTQQKREFSFDKPFACMIEWRVLLDSAKGGTMNTTALMCSPTPNVGGGSILFGPSDCRTA